MALYRYLIDYLDAAGRPCSAGGLAEPGILAASPRDAITKLAEIIKRHPQVARTWTGAQIIPDHGRDGLGRTIHVARPEKEVA